jgi:hypothetical protein
LPPPLGDETRVRLAAGAAEAPVRRPDGGALLWSAEVSQVEDAYPLDGRRVDDHEDGSGVLGCDDPLHFAVCGVGLSVGVGVFAGREDGTVELFSGVVGEGVPHGFDVAFVAKRIHAV